MPERVWTDRQFEEMSWHDNHVHALRIIEGEYGGGQLILDLDYIIEWLTNENRGYKFRIVPVTLTFQEVRNLCVKLDYATPTAGLGPFSIHAIERDSENRWRIAINWPIGEMTFSAKGYEQIEAGVERVSDGQFLSANERRNDV